LATNVQGAVRGERKGTKGEVFASMKEYSEIGMHEQPLLNPVTMCEPIGPTMHPELLDAMARKNDVAGSRSR